VVEPTHVVPRQSTDILFIEDAAVAGSVRFIRQNARRQIAVSDVVGAAGLSRRVLEKRFRTVVGRSVLNEIRHVRVEQISRMLIETNHSISEIAFATGFPGVEHFARYFRRDRHMTPLHYRKTYGRRVVTH
jgi:LacI family transcriptional regulator